MAAGFQALLSFLAGVLSNVTRIVLEPVPANDLGTGSGLITAFSVFG